VFTLTRTRLVANVYLIVSVAFAWQDTGAAAATDPVSYNSRVSKQFRKAPRSTQLICEDNQAEPETLSVEGPFPDFKNIGSEFGMIVSRMVLHQTSNPKGGYDVSRTMVFTINSSAMQRYYTHGVDSHGCSSETFPTGTSIVAGPDGKATFASKMFFAARMCYRNPITGDDHSICGFTDELTTSIVLNFTQPNLSQEDCLNNGTPPEMFSMEQVGNPSFSENRDESSCNVLTLVGVVAGLPSLAGAIFRPVADSASKSMQVALQHQAFVRPESDRLFMCPKGIETANVSPTVLQVSVVEGIDRMPEHTACKLFKQSKRDLMFRAESVNPTKSIQLMAGDSPWRVAARLWGDGRLMTALGPARWSPNTPLNVPNIIEFSSNPNLILDKDTVWGLSIRLRGNPAQQESVFDSISPRPPSIEKIYPYTIVLPPQH
jgi:hypothetical protein